MLDWIQIVIKDHSTNVLLFIRLDFCSLPGCCKLHYQLFQTNHIQRNIPYKSNFLFSMMLLLSSLFCFISILLFNSVTTILLKYHSFIHCLSLFPSTWHPSNSSPLVPQLMWLGCRTSGCS